MKDKIISNVRETTDYSKFKFLEENREVTLKALKRINRSVLKDGWRNYPITVNEKMEIIEGQHTFIYARDNNLPIRYYIQEGATKKDCQIMNSSKTKWTMSDYIHYYSTSGDTNYKYLEILVNRYRILPISTVIGIALRGDISQKVSEGLATITEAQYNDANVKLTYIEKLLPAINQIGGRRVSFIDALMKAYEMPNVDKDRLFNTINKNCWSMSPSSNIEESLKEIERVYNRQLPGTSKVYMVTEWKKSRGE